MEETLSGRDRAHPLRDDLAAMLRGYRAAAGATADLAAAELKLAASTTVLLLALAIAIALFASSAWLLIMLSVAALIAASPDWPGALAAVAVANGLAAIGCWAWMRAATPNLTFRELRAALSSSLPSQEAERHEEGI